jgi:hypothetical protein
MRRIPVFQNIWVGLQTVKGTVTCLLKFVTQSVNKPEMCELKQYYFTLKTTHIQESKRIMPVS